MPDRQPTLVPTPHGDARITVYRARDPAASALTVLLSHGAGGGIEAVDLAALATGLPHHGVDVVLVEQPWRVAGRRLAPAPSALDQAFVAVIGELAPRRPFVVGGRSAGARVACRTAVTVGASAVLGLAFPLRPPRAAHRPDRPDRSRELLGAGVPTLVIQGERDAFGGAGDLPDADHIGVLGVPGADHGFAVRVRDGGAQAQRDGLSRAVEHTAHWMWRAVSQTDVGNT